MCPVSKSRGECRVPGEQELRLYLHACRGTACLCMKCVNVVTKHEMDSVAGTCVGTCMYHIHGMYTCVHVCFGTLPDIDMVMSAEGPGCDIHTYV